MIPGLGKLEFPLGSRVEIELENGSPFFGKLLSQHIVKKRRQRQHSRPAAEFVPHLGRLFRKVFARAAEHHQSEKAEQDRAEPQPAPFPEDRDDAPA